MTLFVVLLVILIAAGAAYYYFFMKREEGGGDNMGGGTMPPGQMESHETGHDMSNMGGMAHDDKVEDKMEDENTRDGGMNS
ncbi:MAG: hypothetical protein HYV65_00125 [Candidatus Spechtbacteria bacterium]|nr:hypothetical protein [Candidatus Spechtbacteria bacterium]